MDPKLFDEARAAFQKAYEAEHADEPTAFQAGLKAAEPFIRTMLEGIKSKGVETPAPDDAF